MDQGVKYVVTLQDINVVSGLHNMEASANKTEASIATLNTTLQSLAGSLGIGFGLKALIDFGKDAVQGAADYETAVKRIKFASEDLIQGVKNIAFISSEADKFKIPLQGATDSYGKFLAMLAGSDIASDKVRSLHDELLEIGKVKGLGDGQLDAAVMNLGKMLESGSLDARHFRPLEQQLSGIGAFVARELGISVHQLAILRNKGKMTQIDPKVLLNAIAKQAASLEQFLPESLTTIQSGINELDNAWLRFKNDLVNENLPELKELFETLKGGIKFLREHIHDIIEDGKKIGSIVEIWVKYKLAIAGINIALNSYKAFTSAYIAEGAAVISSTEMRTVAMNALAASMERVAYATEILAGASLSGAVGLGTSGIPLANAGLVAASGGGSATGAAALGAAGAGMGSKMLKGAIAVTIAYFTAEALSQFLPVTQGGHQMNFRDFVGLSDYGHSVEAANRGLGGYRPGQETHETITKLLEKMYGSKDAIQYDKNGYPVFPGASGNEQLDIQTLQWQASHGMLPRLGAAAGRPGVGAFDNGYKSYIDAKHDKGNADKEKFRPPNDNVTGQRMTSINVKIDRIIGIEKNTVQEGGKMDTTRVAEELRDIINSIVNDTQIRSGH